MCVIINLYFFVASPYIRILKHLEESGIIKLSERFSITNLLLYVKMSPQKRTAWQRVWLV